MPNLFGHAHIHHFQSAGLSTTKAYIAILILAVPELRDLKRSNHYRPLVVLLEYCADCSIRVSQSSYTSS